MRNAGCGRQHRRMGLWLALLLLSALVAARAAPERPLLVGYYAFWTLYQNQNSLEQLPLGQLDYLVYAYAKPLADGTVVPGDYVADLSFAYGGDDGPGSLRGTYAKLRELKAGQPRLRTVLSIGGWLWSTPFPALAADPALRARFARNALDFIDRHGFDGIEIDWKYPVVGGAAGLAARPDDQANKALLLQELRRAMDERSGKGGRRYVLVTTLGVNGVQLAPPLSREEVAPVDFAVVSAYDFHSDDPRRAGHSAPLYGRDAADPMSVDFVGRELARRGVPAAKLVLALDLEATSWIEVPPAGHGIGQPAGGMPFGSWDDTETGPTGASTVAEVLHMQADPAFVEHWDAQAHESSLYHAARRQFVTFESPRAVADKLAWADRAGYAGVALWQLGSDAPDEHSVLRQVYRRYHPWRGGFDRLGLAWQGRPAWLDPLLWVLVTVSALALGAGWHRRRRQREAVQREAALVADLRARLWLLLPLLARLQAELRSDSAREDIPSRPRLPAFVDGLGRQLGLVERQLVPLALAARPPLDGERIEAGPPPSGDAPASAEASPPAGRPPQLVERLEGLNRLTLALGEQRSVEKMLETVMAFLAEEARVRGVALLHGGEVVQRAGDWPAGPADDEAEAAAGGAPLRFSADRAQAWLGTELDADSRLAVAYHAPADAEDEALLRHLLAQIAVVRQHLTELTRQPHVLSELYEIASRKDKLLFIRADKGYSGIHCQDGAMPLYVTLRLRTIRLYFPDEMLLQVHRSYLVNPRRVSKVEYKGKGQYELRIGKESVPVRRQYLGRLRELYPGWFEEV